ncbi:hypothetical protein PIROE2DRAFT_48306, partial [Piromyces sp. E2]
MIGSGNSNTKIALLIDADNISAKYIDIIFEELNKYGDIIIRRVYGNWLNNIIKGWRFVTNKYSLKLIMQENNTSRKNATDICLVIDAMKLLYEKKANMFCIVSSDSDFTRLAKELRENGIDVIGMGENQTPLFFVKSCKIFIVLNQVMKEKQLLQEKSSNYNHHNSEHHQIKKNTSFVEKKVLEQTIAKIIVENNNVNKITTLCEVGSRFQTYYPDFDLKNYGYGNFTSFVKSMASF